MKNTFKHIRIYIFRGFLAIIPLFLCVFAIQLLYVLIDKKVITFINHFIEVRQIPGLGILLLLLSLYLIGLIVSNFIGLQLFKFIEGVTNRIPIIKAIYGIGKQLSQSLSITDGEKMAFKKAVLVNLDNTNLWAPGFVTGEIIHNVTQEKLILVLIPNAPTPASGFVVAVKESNIMDPGWSVEECLKVLVSVGIITPKNFSPNKPL
jgi:uncharacterized membrane protein